MCLKNLHSLPVRSLSDDLSGMSLYSCISMVTNIGLITVMSCKMSLELSSLFLAALESF